MDTILIEGWPLEEVANLFKRDPDAFLRWKLTLLKDALSRIPPERRTEGEDLLIRYEWALEGLTGAERLRAAEEFFQREAPLLLRQLRESCEQLLARIG